jgi:hypothetical protein
MSERKAQNTAGIQWVMVFMVLCVGKMPNSRSRRANDYADPDNIPPGMISDKDRSAAWLWPITARPCSEPGRFSSLFWRVFALAALAMLTPGCRISPPNGVLSDDRRHHVSCSRPNRHRVRTARGKGRRSSLARMFHTRLDQRTRSRVAQTFLSAVPPTFLSAEFPDPGRAGELENPRYRRLENPRYQQRCDMSGLGEATACPASIKPDKA